MTSIFNKLRYSSWLCMAWSGFIFYNYATERLNYSKVNRRKNTTVHLLMSAGPKINQYHQVYVPKYKQGVRTIFCCEGNSLLTIIMLMTLTHSRCEQNFQFKAIQVLIQKKKHSKTIPDLTYKVCSGS